jgi:hypothetical protein
MRDDPVDQGIIQGDKTIDGIIDDFPESHRPELLKLQMETGQR